MSTISGQRTLDNTENDDVQLTDREVEVLRLILEGKSSKEASTILCCSKRTVDFHLARIYQKLGVSNRLQAMRRVVNIGLIPLVANSDAGSGDSAEAQSS